MDDKEKELREIAKSFVNKETIDEWVKGALESATKQDISSTKKELSPSDEKEMLDVLSLSMSKEQAKECMREAGFFKAKDKGDYPSSASASKDFKA